MEEWKTDKPIRSISFNGDQGGSMSVGEFGITRIEATFKSGMHANLPYVRVWKGDDIYAEFCQHALEGVYWESVHSDMPF